VSTHPSSLESETSSPASAQDPTLADVLPLIDGLTTVSAQARQNMASGIRTFCRVLDRPSSTVPIAAAAFRKLVLLAQPAEAGLSTSRWRNVTSDVRRAIKMSGLSTTTPTAAFQMSPAWNELAGRVTDSPARSVVRGFARFCSDCSTVPENVSDAILPHYLDHLHANQLAREPERSLAVLVRAWNKHIATGLPGSYERLTAPSRSRKYALDWQDLPASLLADVKAFHDLSLHPDPLDPGSRRPVKPSTVRNRDYLIRQFAAALVARGVDKDDLQSLADLFRLDRLKEGLRFFLERQGTAPCTQATHIINLALVVAKRWAHLPPDMIAEIALLGRHLRRPQNGLTEKNRTRLRQFADDKVVGIFLGLSHRLITKAKKAPLTYRTALIVQTALAIEILTFAPMRIGNLVQLDRQQHFHWARHNGERVLHLVIKAADVKNDVDLEFPLSTELTAMLDAYMATYQPILTRGRPSGLLFPGAKGKPKNQPGFSRAISATIERETGIKMNPHLFRHFAALLFLEQHPGSYEEVRRILGQKRISTTLQNYAGLEISAAVRRYDEVVLARRGTLPIVQGKAKAAP
jgi:integrase